MKLSGRCVTCVLTCAFALWIAGSAFGATRYVAATGGCGGQTPCYTSIQAAVDASTSGDTIKVAAGTYSGSAPVMVGGITYDQVVIITKSLTVEGGYTPTDWVTPNPTTNLTTIDAGGFGRCVTIVGTGSETVTVVGFTMTGGDYSNLGNPEGVGSEECRETGADCGGGFYARLATLHLSECVITGNTASATRSGHGGGVYLSSTLPGTTIENTVISANDATYPGSTGGGVCLEKGSDATFSGCAFTGNSSNGTGGGLRILQPNGMITVEDSTFTGNSSPESGAGAIDANIYKDGVALKLDRVTMTSNEGSTWGGAAINAVHLTNSDIVVEMNNVILADNTVSSPGTFDPVINVEGYSGGNMTMTARQVTVAGHAGMSVVRVRSFSDWPITATLTNILIDTADSAYVGDESGAGEVTIVHTNTMTNAVTGLHVTANGTPTFTANNPLTGLPKLDASWRLQPGSDAIDAGVDSGVTDDIDGEPRPLGGGFDIGADECAPIFADGFESGSTSLWSITVP